MNDSVFVFIMVVLILVSLLLGSSFKEYLVDKDCENYGKYATVKYVLTCEVKP